MGSVFVCLDCGKGVGGIQARVNPIPVFYRHRRPDGAWCFKGHGEGQKGWGIEKMGESGGVDDSAVVIRYRQKIEDLRSQRDQLGAKLIASELQVRDMTEALNAAKDQLEADGCDCGTDEPESCALCLTKAVLKGTVKRVEDKSSPRDYTIRCDCGRGVIGLRGELNEGGATLRVRNSSVSLNNISCICGKPMIANARMCSGLTLEYAEKKV